MRNQRSRLLMVLLASCGLAGCGTVVPNIKEAWDSDIPERESPRRAPVAGAGQIEFEIKKQIFCDLKRAVQKANSYYVGDYSLPKEWAAQVSLSLEVDESSALNPGVAFNTPMANAISTFGVLPAVTTPQLFSFGVGGTLSSTATRTDKFDPLWTIEELLKPTPEKSEDGEPPPVCGKDPNGDPIVAARYEPAKSSPLIESDLGLTEWLLGAMFTNQTIPSVTGLEPPTDPQLDAQKEQLEAERLVLVQKGFTPPEITQTVASGAFTSGKLDLAKDPHLKEFKKNLKNKLEELIRSFLVGNPLTDPTPQIAKLLALGASPSELLEFSKGGYTMAEITQIVKAKAKASASGGGGSGGGGLGEPAQSQIRSP
jgi:hypothetical protein